MPVIEYYRDDFSTGLPTQLASVRTWKKRDVAEIDDADEVSTDERRHYDRSRLIVDVHFDGVEFTGVASTKDISPGGLYMSTQTRIPVGARLALRIPVGADPLVVKAEVVYSNPGEGVGVKFQDLSGEARKTLENELPAA